MRPGTIRAFAASDFRYRVPELPRCYSGETDPMQRLFARAYLQAQKARQRTEEEQQKDEDCLSAVIATEQDTAETHLSLDQCLELIADRTRRITGADGVAIALRDGAAFICRGRAGALAPDLGARVDPQSGISGACLRTGEVQQCDDTETDSRVDLLVCRNQGIRSILAVPVRRRGVVGILAVFSGWAGIFSERDVRAVSLLAEAVEARLSLDVPRGARLVEATPAQPEPDTTEPHTAESTDQHNTELPPAALALREQALRQQRRRLLRGVVAALVVLAVTSEVVVWHGLHVNEVFRMAKALFATPTPGVTPDPNTVGIKKPAATIPRQQAASKTVSGKTVNPASTPGPMLPRPQQNAVGVKGPLTTTKALPGESPELSPMANPPSPELEGPIDLHSGFAGLETVIQPGVSGPTESAAVPPLTDRNIRENGLRARHKRTNSRAQPEQILELRGELRDRMPMSRAVGAVGIRFAIYAQPRGGAPLWQEVQNVEVDQFGYFRAQVGSTSAGGFPEFARGLWLGWLVQQPGEVERRMWLVDTPSGFRGEGAVGQMADRD